METGALQRKVKAGDLPLERVVANRNISQPEKIKAAGRAFEAVLLRQILESAQKPVIVSGLTTETSATAVYRDMVTTQLADSISRSGQFGLARSFNQEWQRAAGGKAPTGGPAVGPEPKPSASSPSTPPVAPARRSLRPFLHPSDLKPYRHE